MGIGLPGSVQDWRQRRGIEGKERHQRRAVKAEQARVRAAIEREADVLEREARELAEAMKTAAIEAAKKKAVAGNNTADLLLLTLVENMQTIQAQIGGLDDRLEELDRTVRSSGGCDCSCSSDG